MKKTTILLLILIIATGLLYAKGSAETSDKRIKVIATVFPEYDWVREIIGDNPGDIDLRLLLDSGVDLHNFQPSADDIIAISNCDVFIYVGGESDEWAEDILEKSAGKVRTIRLTQALGNLVKEEEHKEGMQEQEHEHEHEHEEEYDEHVWLSLRNAAVLCSEIARVLSETDPQNAPVYKANLDSYLNRLGELDARYAAAVEKAAFKTLLFADRFPFRYLADDYNLDYFAAFSGCSAETEASFETIAFLVKKVDELGLRSIITIDGSDGKIARTIADNSKSRDLRILSMDSMQSVTASLVSAGASYLGIMEKNLEVLSDALN